jgi:hypothetical protein
VHRVALEDACDDTNTSLASFTLIMSSSEENYDLDDISGDESEGYSPVSKKTVSTSHHLRYS